MASQISSTPRTERSCRGFTLAEVIIATGVSTFVMLALLTSFLLIGKTGANIQNYTVLEANARKGLELFSREARLAYGVATGASATSVTLNIPDSSSSRTGTGTGAYSVTYTFDATAGTLSRTGPPIDNPTGTSATTVLSTGLQQIPGSPSAVPFLNYYRYVTGGGYSTGFQTNTAASITEVKQIEISFLLRLQSNTVAAATNKVLSARFILRNK